jgi:hypothetical protein
MKWWGLICLLMLVAPTSAQEAIPTPEAPGEDTSANHPYYVFLERGSVNDTLIFVDGLTGETQRVTVTGERYTVYQLGVMFYDRTLRRVMIAQPDGNISEHPYIRLAPEVQRVDWVIADNGERLAWTVVGTDVQGRLTTRTTIANIDGTGIRPVYTEVDADGNRLRALPIGFSADNETLYMDNYPDGIEQFIAFNQYVGIFALDLNTQATTLLPGEQGSSCICGGAIRDDLFLRLRLNIGGTRSGFDMHIYNLSADTEDVIPAPNVGAYDTAGDVLISDDGSQAIYALASITDFNTPTQRIETVFVLVDVSTLEQRVLNRSPLTLFVRPVTWTEDNSAVIFTNPEQDGTWKINISDGRLERIADATYLGIYQQT